MTISPTRFAAFVMLERDRRPQLISVVDVVGVDGLPPPLPRSNMSSPPSGRRAAGRCGVRRFVQQVARAFRRRFRRGSLSRRFFRRPRNAAEGAGEPVRRRGLCHRRRGRSSGISCRTRLKIPPWFDPAETLLFAAACIKGGRVKFCPPTIDKMAIHPLGAALSFKADDPVEAALQGAFLAAISLKFDHQLSSKPKRRA